MWYISFHGGKTGENNIHVYHDDGKPHQHDKLLSPGSHKLDELRGFALQGDHLYVVEAHKTDSKILKFKAADKKLHQFNYDSDFASGKTINGIWHPYDIAFDSKGNAYISSQDSNVVTAVNPSGTAFSIPSALAPYQKSGTFLEGTVVASSVPLANGGTLPPAVPAPAGLLMTTDKSGQTHHSVRGVAFWGEFLFVCDEPGNAVKIYEAGSFSLVAQIAGNGLSAPVQLLTVPKSNMLYIGSPGNSSVYNITLSSIAAHANAGTPPVLVATVYINGQVPAVSGFGFDAPGNFYAALREKKQVVKFTSPSSTPTVFIDGLKDNPEFLLYVPE